MSLGAHFGTRNSTWYIW